MKRVLSLFCLLFGFGFAFLLFPLVARAEAKYSVVLDAYETAQKPSSPEPARLVNKILREELEKGGLVHIVERKNAAPGAKMEPAPYYVGAKIDGLGFLGTKPVQISIIMDLTRFSNREILLMFEKSRFVEPKVIEASAKLTNAEFDNSEYGKALVELSRDAVKAFEAKVANLKN